MESFFAHNDLNIDFDDIKSLDDHMNAIMRLNEFEQEHIYQIQALELQILEKRKVLSEKYDKLSQVQHQTDKLNKMKKIENLKRTFERLEMDFSDSLYAYLLSHGNILCNPDQRIERVSIPLNHELGNEFAIYIDPSNNQIVKLCIVNNDSAQTERELEQEEILSVFFDFNDIVNRDLKKGEIVQEDPEKLFGLEMNTLLLGLAKQNHYRDEQMLEFNIGNTLERKESSA